MCLCGRCIFGNLGELLEWNIVSKDVLSDYGLIENAQAIELNRLLTKHGKTEWDEYRGSVEVNSNSVETCPRSSIAREKWERRVPFPCRKTEW